MTLDDDAMHACKVASAKRRIQGFCYGQDGRRRSRGLKKVDSSLREARRDKKGTLRAPRRSLGPSPSAPLSEALQGQSSSATKASRVGADRSCYQGFRWRVLGQGLQGIDNLDLLRAILSGIPLLQNFWIDSPGCLHGSTVKRE